MTRPVFTVTVRRLNPTTMAISAIPNATIPTMNTDDVSSLEAVIETATTAHTKKVGTRKNPHCVCWYSILPTYHGNTHQIVTCMGAFDPGGVVGSSQIVRTGTTPQENPVFVRASARLRGSHSTKGCTHEAENLLGAIGQSETEIRCS